MHTLLVVNPVSGQGRAAREKRKLLDFASRLPGVEAELAESPEGIAEAVRAAIEGGVRRIIAAGGDGTINVAINAIGDSRVPLGIVPLGTGNVLAHHLGIDAHNTEEALRVIERHHIIDVDIAEANGKRFLLMAGLGFDAAVVETVSPRVKDVLGTMAYAPAALAQLFTYAPTLFRLEFAEGSVCEVKAFAVIAANCGTYAYNFRIAPEARIDDGMLDILIFEAPNGSTLQFLGQALGSLFQQRLRGSDTIYFRSSGVRISSQPEVKVQVDGDVCMETPIDLKILPKALRLIVPEDSKE